MISCVRPIGESEEGARAPETGVTGVRDAKGDSERERDIPDGLLPELECCARPGGEPYGEARDCATGVTDVRDARGEFDKDRVKLRGSPGRLIGLRGEAEDRLTA